ncbi:MAG: hypothetical protein K0S41_2098 [Anaerocolumna sp.]|jgi:spore germination protein|nr:hypothetical protein [Anaerocolumna sp.]
MSIHVVQPGETVQSIADEYNISVTSLIRDNDITNPDALVVGQTLVIVNPEQTYIIKEGDTLESIAGSFNIPVMQLLRNNPYITDFGYLPIGDTLVISYQTNGRIATNGYAIPNINKSILRKTLPYLTYLTLYNYRATREGEIVSYFDETELIQIAKEYGVAPLMLITTLTSTGEANVETGYEILLNEDIQDKHINKMIEILNSMGYYGINLSLQYLSIINETLYEAFIKRVSNRIHEAGFTVFLNINPRISFEKNIIEFQKINYSKITEPVEEVTFMNFVWASNLGPPSPVISYNNLSAFLDYADGLISPSKMNVGLQTFGYDWELPYVVGFTRANELTVNQATNLAYNEEVIIHFDEDSQTPFFEYISEDRYKPTTHIVWFIDARIIDSILNLIESAGYNGISVWNIVDYYSALWLMINSQYNIEKITNI